jgi:hypothetical protein
MSNAGQTIGATMYIVQVPTARQEKKFSSRGLRKAYQLIPPPPLKSLRTVPLNLNNEAMSNAGQTIGATILVHCTSTYSPASTTFTIRISCLSLKAEEKGQDESQ